MFNSDNSVLFKIKSSIRNIPNFEDYAKDKILNCYAYALGITYPCTGLLNYYPGLLLKKNNYLEFEHPATFKAYYMAIQSDCKLLDLKISTNYDTFKLYKNQHIIGIYHHIRTSLEEHTAAHFVRYDVELGWSHKLGWHNIPELIEEPKKEMLFGISKYHLVGYIVIEA